MNRHERRRLQRRQRLAPKTSTAQADPAQTLHLAIRHHRAGQPEQAKALCRQALKARPDHVEALNLLALLVFQEGDKDAAADLIRRALARDPESAEAHNNLGNILLDQGDLGQAAGCYRRALTCRPGYVEAQNNLGNVLARSQKFDEAMACYQGVIESKPDYPDAHHNLGNVLRQQGRFDEARSAYNRALALSPGWAEAHIELGRTCQLQGDLDGAADCYRRALKSRPTLARAHAYQADCLALLDRHEAAETAFRRALQIQPDYAAAASGLGNLLATQGRAEQAIASFDRALAADPEHATAAHMKAALTGLPNREAPREYVKTLFDSYAGRFDQHLVDRLDYQVPLFLKEAVAEVAAGRKDWVALDIGCGTGLCGLEFRPLAKQLVGIDLAPLMVARAHTSGAYDEVHEAEITEFLADSSVPFDLAIAGDVFIYVGALEDVFAALSRTLPPGGLCAFSIERSETDEVVLRPTGRFAHSLAYVDRLASDHGFALALNREVPIRKQGSESIPGNVLVLARQ